MASRPGSSASRITVSEVWNGTEASPGMSGITGRLPAATTIWSAVISSVPTWIRRGPTKWHRRLNTVMLAASSR